MTALLESTWALSYGPIALRPLCAMAASSANISFLLRGAPPGPGAARFGGIFSNRRKYCSISGSFLGGLVGISKSHMLHILQHMGNMGGAVVRLVAHHRCMLALGDASFLEGLVDRGLFGHF